MELNTLIAETIHDADGPFRPVGWTLSKTNKFKTLPLGPAQTVSAAELVSRKMKISVPLKLYNEICVVYGEKRDVLEFGYEIYESSRMMYLLSSRGELRNLSETVMRWSVSGCDSGHYGCDLCENLIEASKMHRDHIYEQHWNFVHCFEMQNHQDMGIETVWRGLNG